MPPSFSASKGFAVERLWTDAAAIGGFSPNAASLRHLVKALDSSHLASHSLYLIKAIVSPQELYTCMRPDFYQWIEQKIAMPIAVDDKKGTLRKALAKSKRQSKKDYKGDWENDPSHVLATDLKLTGRNVDPFAVTRVQIAGPGTDTKKAA